MLKDVLGMVFSFAAFVAFWLWCVYGTMTSKGSRKKHHVWLKWFFLATALIISASLTLYFFDSVISALLKNIFA